MRRVIDLKIRRLIIIVAFISILVCGYKVYESKSLANAIDNNNEIDNIDNSESRVIIQLKEKPAIDKIDNIEDTKELKISEEKVLNSQKDTIKKVENITGNKIENQTGLLMNSIVIYATDLEIEQIKKIDNVCSIDKAYTYILSNNLSTLSYSVEEYKEISKFRDKVTGVTTVQDEYEYTGVGTVVAILDSGINTEHIDMVWDENITPKYSEEEWKEKISILGHGKYISSKVPYGYNYVDNNTDISDSAENHGYHVAGIVGSNGNLEGVAANAQLVALKIMGSNGGGTSDQLVNAIEDAVMLGVDVINMSIGVPYGMVEEDSFQDKAIKKASEQGIVCCIAAGNIATADGLQSFSNRLKLTDTATINTPAVVEEGIAVAATNIFKHHGQVANEVSKFSSWGPTNELTIKPEITAPGENILSTVEGKDKYETLSGTSMATPYVSGCVALIINEVKNNSIKLFNTDTVLSGKELNKYIKSTLMNTAEPICENVYHNKSYNLPYSIRLQGAGLVQIDKAIKNRVIVTCKDVPKIELGEVGSDTEFEVELRNYGDTDVTYTVEGSEVYEALNTDKSEYYTVKSSAAKIDISGTVTVPAHEKVTIKGSLKVSDEYKYNTFVEGYVRFRCSDGEKPSLSMPLLAFYGDWEAEPIIDKSVYDNGKSYLESNSVVNMIKSNILKSNTCLLGNKKCYEIDGEYKEIELGKIEEISNEYDGDLVAISPNGDGNLDTIYPGITQLRNAYELKVNVLDKDMKVIKEIGTLERVQRSSYVEITTSKCKKLKDLFWDGTVYDAQTNEVKQVEDGQYFIQIEVKLTKRSEPKYVTMPVKIDTKVPIIEESKIVKKDNSSTYICRVKDDVALAESIIIYINDELYEYKYSNLEKDIDGNVYIDMGDVQGKDIHIIHMDRAGNEISVRY